jgi:hypothetical protein
MIISAAPSFPQDAPSIKRRNLGVVDGANSSDAVNMRGWLPNGQGTGYAGRPHGFRSAGE